MKSATMQPRVPIRKDQPERARLARVGLALAAAAGYAGVFFAMHPLLGAPVVALSWIPVAGAGWLLGFWGGLLGGIIAFPLNAVLLTLAGESGWQLMSQSAISGTLSVVLIGAIIGRLRDRSDRLRRELAERRRLEIALRESEARLIDLAMHDSLTRLPNRLLFLDRLQHALAKAAREGLMVAVLFLDIDDFKNVNDLLGHKYGDLLLQVVGERLLRCVREGDTVARLGGDEFAIILENSRQTEDAVRVSRRILEAFTRPVQMDQHQVIVTTSIGISLFPEDGADPDTLINKADQAMYRVKWGGKNSFEFYKPLE